MLRPPTGPRLPLTLVALALVATACGGSEAAAPGGSGLEVVVTTSILGDVVEGIVGDAGTVEVLIGPGQDAHSFSPSARQAQALRDADLVVAVGLGLEELLLDTIEAAEEDGARVLRVAEHLDPIEAGGHADDHADEHVEGAGDTKADDHADEPHDEHGNEHGEEGAAEYGTEAGEVHFEGDGHDHGPLDPHVWHDPLRMADAAGLIATALGELPDAPSHVDWGGRGEAVAADIRAAHEDAMATLAAVPDACRTLVTNHDALGYLAARYDFEVIGTVIPGTSSQAEPSAQELAALADLVRDAKVPAVFAEVENSTRIAAALAAEVGGEIAVVALHTESLGGPDSDARTYPDLVRANARLIAEALVGC